MNLKSTNIAVNLPFFILKFLFTRKFKDYIISNPHTPSKSSCSFPQDPALSFTTQTFKTLREFSYSSANVYYFPFFPSPIYYFPLLTYSLFYFINLSFCHSITFRTSSVSHYSLGNCQRLPLVH